MSKIYDPVAFHAAQSDLGALVERYGFGQFAYAHNIVHGEITEGTSLLSNYTKEWCDAYWLSGVGANDPVRRQTYNHERQISWLDVAETSENAAQFFQKAGAFGVSSIGFSIPIRIGADRWSLFSISAAEFRAPGVKSLEEMRFRALSLALEFHNDIFPSYASNAPEGRISTREREVLHWAALGKTAWETGAIIGLKELSVQAYLKNACIKLGAANKTAAVAAAIRAGII